MKIKDEEFEKENLQIVIFRIGEDYLSCPISQVREIIQLQEITPVPSTPNTVEGIINRRGDITTVLNLPEIIGIDVDLDKSNSQLMILFSENDDIGVMVSEVTEIPTVERDDIEKPSGALETPVNKEYLKGILKNEEELTILIDLISLVNNTAGEDIKEIESLNKEFKQ